MTVICQLCTLRVLASQARLDCAVCRRSFHAGCCSVSQTDLQFMKDERVAWKCQQCISAAKGRHDNPVGNLDGGPPPSAQLTVQHFEQLMSAITSLQKDTKEGANKLNDLKASIDTIGIQLEATRAQFEDSLAECHAEIASLKLKNIDLQKQIETLRDKKSCSLDTHEVLHEVSEQQKRRNNLLIFNFMEASGGDSDSGSVVELLHALDADIPTDDLEVTRIGALSSGTTRPRPVKITFPKQEYVYRVLRKTKLLRSLSKYRSVSVSRDRTPYQTALYRTAKAELQERLAGGETNLRIQYIKEVPKVVSASRSGGQHLNESSPTESQ